MSRAWSIRTSRIPFRHPNPSRPVTPAAWRIPVPDSAWEALTVEYSDEPEPMSKTERRKRWLERRAEKQQERQRRRMMLQKNLQAARDALTAAEARMIEYQESVDSFDQRLAVYTSPIEAITAAGVVLPEDRFARHEFIVDMWNDAWGPLPVHPGDKRQDQARLDQARQAVEAARAEVVRLDPKPVEPRRGRPSKHGEAPRGRKPIIYKACENMKQRCSPNPSASSYADYYGRSIRICELWLTSYANFREDVFPIFEKTWKPGRKFDRIDNHGHYEPGNVEWRTNTKSNQNRRKPQ